MYFPILLQVIFVIERTCFFGLMGFNLNVFCISIFYKSVCKYISVKIHWYLNQLIDLHWKSMFKISFYETVVYIKLLNGTLENYRLNYRKFSCAG